MDQQTNKRMYGNYYVDLNVYRRAKGYITIYLVSHFPVDATPSYVESLVNLILGQLTTPELSLLLSGCGRSGDE